MTEDGLLIGTPGYLAPEVIAGGRAGPDADRYALAAVAFAVLTGRPPFRADRPEAPLRPRPPARPAGAPCARACRASVDAVLARGLAKRPEDRPRSGAALAGALVPRRPAPAGDRTVALAGRAAALAAAAGHASSPPPASRPAASRWPAAPTVAPARPAAARARAAATAPDVRVRRRGPARAPRQPTTSPASAPSPTPPPPTSATLRVAAAPGRRVGPARPPPRRWRAGMWTEPLDVDGPPGRR